MSVRMLRRLLDTGGVDSDGDNWTGDQFLAETTDHLTDLQITAYVTISICLILMAGLMSGLTLGLMSLDTVELEVLKRSGTPDEKRCASIIMPVIKNQHFLLVTLLLCNAASTEALPLFIDRLADPVTAVIVSVTSVLVFGEIIPQAICSRYGLKVGAYASWFVRGLMILCSPLAWPIGKLLDFLLGHEQSALFRRAQLKALVDVHSSSAGFGGTLSEQEIAVIRGALDLTSKTAAKSMTPLDKVFMLSSDDRLDERTMQAILLSGHSRIPVYRDGNRKEILGLILSKELVLIDPADNLAVSQLKIRPLPRLSADTPMYDMLKLFETGKSHMALLMKGIPVQSSEAGKDKHGSKNGKNGHSDSKHSNGFSHKSNQKAKVLKEEEEPLTARLSQGGSDHMVADGEPIGIITIEDVIEELLQEEIIDETDLFVDNLQATRVNAAEVTGALPPRLQRMLNAGLFTPRVGRLGSPQRFMMPPGMTDDVSAHRHMELHQVDKDEEGGLYSASGKNGQISIPLVPVHDSVTEAKPRSGVDSNGKASRNGSGGSAGPGWLPKLKGHHGNDKDRARDMEASQPLLSMGSTKNNSSQHS